MNITILVINLKKSCERRRMMKNQLDTLSFPYTFLDATEGSVLTDKWIEKNIGKRFKNIYYNNLHYSVNKNALACADSHRRAQIIASKFKGGYTLILEDDVELSRGFEKKVKKTVELMESHSLHLSFLGYNWSKGKFEKRKDIKDYSSNFAFFKYPLDGHVSGAFAYLVDSVGARKLVQNNLEKIQDTADTFYVNEKGLNENTVVLYPKIVTTGYLASDIGYIKTGSNDFNNVKNFIISVSMRSKITRLALLLWKERRL